MGGVARLARALGHRVTGVDANVYPPMSEQLRAAGIALAEGYDTPLPEPAPDRVLIGNALSRGNPAVEAVLERGLDYLSGPEWLRDEVLRGRQVLAVAGTHGKTTTSSMLAHVLDAAGLDPGFLIGGVPAGFGVSARLGSGPFVIEADEYDTAFFDKRPKFLHYRPQVAVLHNLEFDHADIYSDLGEIQRQFHYLVRTVPPRGRILRAAGVGALDRVLDMGVWSRVSSYGIGEDGGDWGAELLAADGSRFRLRAPGGEWLELRWTLLGRHNVANALAAVAAAAECGVDPAAAARALEAFRPPRRRLELRGLADGVRVYDDFAHHPSAIAATLEALRAHVGPDRIVAVLEPRSNTMRMGVHAADLASALGAADRVYLFRPPGLDWDPERALAPLGDAARVFDSHEALLAALAAGLEAGDHALIMSNGAFGGLHDRLLAALQARQRGDREMRG